MGQTTRGDPATQDSRVGTRGGAVDNSDDAQEKRILAEIKPPASVAKGNVDGSGCGGVGGDGGVVGGT